MAKLSRDKGGRIEREIVNRHRSLGLKAERVPDSGASKYQDSGHDIDIYPFGPEAAPLVCEVKARASGAGFTMIERWLANYDVCFLRRNGQEPLVVVPWSTWVRLVK